MIEGSEKRNHQLAFELQNSHFCKNRSKLELSAFTEVVQWIVLTGSEGPGSNPLEVNFS